MKIVKSINAKNLQTYKKTKKEKLKDKNNDLNRLILIKNLLI